MKNIFQVVIIFSFVLISCKKSSNSNSHVNCEELITDTIGTGDTARIYMQNAFSPNGDGINESSRPVFKGIASLTFSVYDNNNNLVFTTSQLNTPGPNGLTTTTSSWQPVQIINGYEVYYYKIQATTLSNHQIGICGELYKLSCFPSSIPQSLLFFESQLRSDGTYSTNSSENLPNCP